MKSFPLSDEFLADTDEIRHAAWAAINGKKLPKETLSKLAHTLDILDYFNKYGQEDRCTSQLFHGPGHQSRCLCELEPGHEGVHRGRGGANDIWEWKGTYAFTGFFDELPDPYEED